MMPVARISELRAGKGALFQAAFQAGPHSGQALISIGIRRGMSVDHRH